MPRPHVSRWLLRGVVLLAAWCGAPCIAVAQTVPALAVDAAPAPSATLPFPRLTVSLGVGSAKNNEGLSSSSLQSGSIQYRVSRHLGIEGEVAHRDVHPEFFQSPSQAWSAGGNILYQSEPTWVSWFAGTGAFLDRHQKQGAYCYLTCTASQVVQETQPGILGLAGAELRVAGPVRFYADLRFRTIGQGYLQMSAGVRMVALTRREETEAARRTRRIGEITADPAMAAAPGLGKEVRVTAIDGSVRKGLLVSLSGSEVVLKGIVGGGSMAIPLGQVRRVERVSHHVRNGAGIGFLTGVGIGVIACHGKQVRRGRTVSDCWADGYDYTFVNAVFAGGLGAGVGAAIGAMMKASSGLSRILYEAPARTTVSLAPAIGTASLGVAGRIAW